MVSKAQLVQKSLLQKHFESEEIQIAGIHKYTKSFRQLQDVKRPLLSGRLRCEWFLLRLQFKKNSGLISGFVSKLRPSKSQATGAPGLLIDFNEAPPKHDTEVEVATRGGQLAIFFRSPVITNRVIDPPNLLDFD